MPTKPWREIRRPLNHLFKNDWYWDHEKRLRDAEIAQFGHEDEDGVHPDGLHRHHNDPFARY